MKLNWKSCLIASASVFLLYLAIQYWSGIVSFIGSLGTAAGTLLLGGMIAYIVNILMSVLESRIAPKCGHPLWVKLRRPLCMLLSFAIIVLILLLLFRLIVPQMVECFEELVTALMDGAPKAYDWLNERFAISEFLDENAIVIPATGDEWRALLDKYADLLLTGVGGFMNFAVKLTSEVLSTLVMAFISLIFAIYILSGKEKLAGQFNRLGGRLLGQTIMGKLHHGLSVLDDCFRSYIIGQLLEALILGGLCAVGMLILRLEYALMISAVIGVLALIPVAGAYIGAAVGAVMLFSVSPAKALVFLIFLLVLQQVEGNIIYPRTVGSSLHLPGIWVLAAVTVGGSMMGVLGMVVFVPITAAVYRLLGEWSRVEGKPSLAEQIRAFDKPEPCSAGVCCEANAAADGAPVAASPESNETQESAAHAPKRAPMPSQRKSRRKHR